MIRHQDRLPYYDALKAAQGGDTRPFVRFISHCTDKTLDVYLFATTDDSHAIDDKSGGVYDPGHAIDDKSGGSHDNSHAVHRIRGIDGIANASADQKRKPCDDAGTSNVIRENGHCVSGTDSDKINQQDLPPYNDLAYRSNKNDKNVEKRDDVGIRNLQSVIIEKVGAGKLDYEELEEEDDDDSDQFSDVNNEFSSNDKRCSAVQDDNCDSISQGSTVDGKHNSVKPKIGDDQVSENSKLHSTIEDVNDELVDNIENGFETSIVKSNLEESPNRLVLDELDVDDIKDGFETPAMKSNSEQKPNSRLSDEFGFIFSKERPRSQHNPHKWLMGEEIPTQRSFREKLHYGEYSSESQGRGL